MQISRYFSKKQKSFPSKFMIAGVSGEMSQLRTLLAARHAYK
jgi:hypothetical protein